MLFKKLWRTMGLYKAQFLSMIIMVALGSGMFVGFNMEWYSIKENTEDMFRKTGFADYRIISESGFSAEDRKDIAAIPGADKAARFISVTAEVREYDQTSVALTVTEDIDVSGFYLMSGKEYDSQDEEGIWISDRFASEHGIQCGDELTFCYQNASLKGIVRGLIKSGEYLICVRDETQLMPDFKTFAFAYISPAMYQKNFGFTYYPQIHVISQLDKKDFIEQANQALGQTTQILTKDNVISYSGAKGEMEEGQTMGSVLPVLFLLIGMLTMVTTMHRLAAKEKTQIGTLKALGLKDRRILFHYTSYALMIGLIGIAIGIVIGYGIAYIVMNPNGMMGTYMDLPQWKLCFPTFCYVVLIIMFVLLTAIGYLSVKSMLRGTASDALRPYVPKKIKPLLIEKTNWFHKLSFGTRWNLRDITRHKARTLMSLIGTVGCMTLIVGSLGMGDTMNAFLDLYYGGATNYASRIYLSPEATAEEREKIIDQYQGDASASLGVQLDEDTVSLDIYHITQDRVRFPDQRTGYTELKTDGAYICVRIADEHHLKPGDRFTISPYGSETKYVLQVAGIIRSVSQCIVIHSDYAAELGIDFLYDSVYTETARENIASDHSIKNVQSKQMIMDSFDSFLEIMDTMIYILIAGALILGIVVLYNLGIMSYAERYREMATLKVVGFQDRRIGRLLTQQNLWLSVAGIVLGLPAGIGALDYLVGALASEYELKTSISVRTIVISILLTVGMALLVSAMVSRKNKKIDMVEALKGTE